jgi:hypothetical protein
LLANQDVTFLTDGGEEIRALTELVTPASEHVLDWFHITMRLTVLEKFARGVAHRDEAAGANLLADLERIKWLLWHGNQHRAGETIGFFLDDVDALQVDYPKPAQVRSRGARVRRLHRRQDRQPDQLWRAVPRRRAHILMPSGIHGERRDQQVLRQTSADGVDQAWRTPCSRCAREHSTALSGQGSSASIRAWQTTLHPAIRSTLRPENTPHIVTLSLKQVPLDLTH